MRTNKHLLLTMLALALIALSAPGCIFSPDSDDNDPPPVDDDYADATTPTILVDNFKIAYQTMDIDGYENMLDNRFQFIFIEGEGPSATFNKQEDVSSTRNMFSGEPHTNPDGQYSRGISSITVETLNILEQWDDVSAAHPYFGDIEGAKKALYEVRFVLYHDNGTITVDSNQMFFAAPDGEGTWFMVGQQDLGGS